MSQWQDETAQLKAEEVVLRSTLAQRPARLPAPPLPASPPPPVPSGYAAIKGLVPASSEDEGRPSTSSSDDDDTSSSLRIERSRPSPPTPEDAFKKLPWHIMRRIFVGLEIRERAMAAAVCKRWYNILTNGHCPLRNVVVLNVFQKSVWLSTVSKNAGSSVQCVHLPDEMALLGILLHISAPASVKIWYNTPAFAKLVLEKLKEVGVETKCVDIFPYSNEVGIDIFHEHMPDLTGITMRPHGTQHFWEGLDLQSFPNFERLDTLILDSFNLKEDAELPQSITTLEWQNRREKSFAEVMPKIKKLHNLEYLLVGQADLQASWDDFLDIVDGENMPRLSYLMFRFCRFGRESYPDRGEEELPEMMPGRENALKRLQFLKLDLCYGYLPRILSNFLDMTSEALKIVSLNVISDESAALYTQIFDIVAKRVLQRKASLHLGLLQKSNNKETDGRHEFTERGAYPTPSEDFERVLWKFESSFCGDSKLLGSFFLLCRYPYLSDIKFIQCPALDNELLGAIAARCPRLKKISLIGCDKVTEEGILQFLTAFRQRSSKNLDIIWKHDRPRFSSPSGLLRLITPERLDTLQVKHYRKSSAKPNSGESIVIRDPATGKSLVIQDYDQNDHQRILGVVMPFDLPEQPESSTPAPLPSVRAATPAPAPAPAPAPLENLMSDLQTPSASSEDPAAAAEP